LRHEIVREIRTSGLMVGIELGAPSARAARVSWRLIHLASEGLFPQLIVIPLHRDHGVITMAAGKNDVIKLLPPLTITGSQVQVFLAALDAVLADCEGASGKNWGVVRDIATATLRRHRAAGRDQRPAAGAPGPAPAGAGAARIAAPAPPVRAGGSSDELCLVTGASGFIGGRL